MILVTGGLGFVGLHATRALLEAGEPCVLVQRREPVLPDDLAGEAGRWRRRCACWLTGR
jgi:UDP-glucose 4-epimerase